MELKEIILFTYRGKNVKTKVIRIDENGFLGELLTDYIGKNESWYSGESKWFEFNIMNR